MAKIKTVRAQVLEISTDRTQYAPYKYKLQPIGLMVELTLPTDSIVEEDKDGVMVVTMDGFSLLLGNIADSLGEMHKVWEGKMTGLRR